MRYFFGSALIGIDNQQANTLALQCGIYDQISVFHPHF